MAVRKKLHESIDRISDLSNDILCHILSFLPTKDAVRTSILSTRWKGLFALVPSLDFDDTLFLHPQNGKRKGVNNSCTFMNFVDRLLFQCSKSRKDKFRLKCTQSVDSSRVNAWICSFRGDNIEELDLWISVEKQFIVPPIIFTCKTLVVLKLGTKLDVLNVPADVCFPCLKILHLDSIVFLDYSEQRLFSACPVLKDLSIQGSEWKKRICELNISSPALERLSLNCLTGDGCSYEGKQKIVIDTPRLLCLNYCDFVAKCCSLVVVNLHSLAEAHIGVGLTSGQVKKLMKDIHSYDAPVAEIARAISSVQSFYIYGDFMKALSFCCNPLPMFNNLTSLKLKFCKNVGWQILAELLESSPNLETLIFESLLDDDFPAYWYPPEKVPSCLLHKLETVMIGSFQGKKDELVMVEYFLKNAKVLKKMKINVVEVAEKEQWKITKNLLKLARGSDKSEVEIL